MKYSNAIIEFASLSDATEIATLSRTYIEYDLGWDYTPEKISRLIRHPAKNVVVAREQYQLVGFGIMTYFEEDANLDLLGVKLRYRYQGIGREIVAWLEKVALTAGIMTIHVQVRAVNTGAIKFYRKLGYQVVSEQRGYYRGLESAVIMSKAIRHRP